MWIAFFNYQYWTLQGLKLSGATLHINKFLPISSLQVQVAFYQTRNDFLLTFFHYFFFIQRVFKTNGLRFAILLLDTE